MTQSELALKQIATSVYFAFLRRSFIRPKTTPSPQRPNLFDSSYILLKLVFIKTTVARFIQLRQPLLICHPFRIAFAKHSLIPPTRQTRDPAHHLQSQPAFPSIHRSILWISIDLLSINFLPLLLILTIRLSISFSLSKIQYQDVWSTR